MPAVVLETVDYNEGMYFYEVLVSTAQFRSKEPPTYQSHQALPVGTVVTVPLQTNQVAGTILRSVAKPRFPTKAIIHTVTPQPIPQEALQLITWLQSYYPTPIGIAGQLLLPGSLVRKRDLPSVTAAATASTTMSLPPLSQDQQRAVEQINQLPMQQTFLIHGNTGTGKTRLYMELALQVIQQGRSALILTPEIGLTPQLEHTLQSSMPVPVITIHSNLSPAERRTVWLQILLAKEPIVVIGPRSSLFTPMHNIGLVVADEAHDQAYKQEQAPYYHALRVASQLAHLHHARLILGTATPQISDYFLAQAKKVPIIRLTQRPAGEETHRTIELINLRDREQFKQQPHISTVLLEHIRKAINNKQQALVFLNRRGTARLVLCQLCGWTAVCPHCDLPLTYHADHHKIQCHTCGHQETPPTKCPECNGTDIIFKSIGTKSIVQELQKEFPAAIIKRFDTDSLKDDRLEQQYHDIQSGKVDVLVGTQMLAKGLDLPRLAVVGVVMADTSLYFPDYTAEERTYQLLTQVIGRVGRGHVTGTVVLQTYNPDSPAIQAAVHNTWEAFYAQQLKERASFGFPPYYHCLKIVCLRASSKAAQKASDTLARLLESSGLRIIVIGPSPSFHEKQGGKYRWQIIVKAKNRNELLRVIPLLPANWTYDLDPTNLL